jgi:hypothetical protein
MANPLPKPVNQWSNEINQILEDAGVTTTGSGNLIVDSVVENAAETAISTIVSGIDPAEVIKLETISSLMIAFYLAIPSVGRAAAARLFSKKLKSLIGPQLTGSPAVLALLEGIDQANPAVTAMLEDKNLKPEDFRKEILAKAAGPVSDFKAWMSGIAPQAAATVQAAVAAPTQPPPPPVSITMNPNLLLLTTLRKENAALPELLAALENGALLEKKKDPTGPRPWLGQASAFLKGLNILTSTEDGRNIIREEMLLVHDKLFTSHGYLPTDDLQAKPFDYAPEFISLVVKLGRENTQLPFVAGIPAGWLDSADQFVEIEGVLNSLRQFFGKDVFGKDGNRLVQVPPETWSIGWWLDKAKWSGIAFLIGLPAASLFGICLFVMSAISICWVTAQQDAYALAAGAAVSLAFSGTIMVASLVIIVVTRLFYPFLDGPFNLLAKLLHKVGLRDSEAPIAPAFRNSNLISIIASGLTVLFLVMAGLTFIGGGSSALVLLAFCGIGALAAWGETMKRYHNSPWSDHGAVDHGSDDHGKKSKPAAGIKGEERKLIDAEERFRWGISLFNRLMIGFFGALVLVGLATAGYRYYEHRADELKTEAAKAEAEAQAAADAAKTKRQVDCQEATVQLDTWATQWNVADGRPADGNMATRMCSLDQQPKVKALCAKQISLCR